MTHSRPSSAALPAPIDVADDAADPDDFIPLDTPSFVPVPVRERCDGWTPARQVAFIDALAQTGCVEQAARAVRMTARSAYRLRQHVDAAWFRIAWEGALTYAVGRLADAAMSRAIHGVSRPIFYRGEQVGEWRHYDERLTQFLLRTRDPQRFGRKVEVDPAGTPPPLIAPPDNALPALATAALQVAQGVSSPRMPTDADLDAFETAREKADEDAFFHNLSVISSETT